MPVLAGPGAPDFGMGERHGDMLVVDSRDWAGWWTQFAVSEPILDEVAAHVAVCELLTCCGQRIDYELAHSR